MVSSYGKILTIDPQAEITPEKRYLDHLWQHAARRWGRRGYLVQFAHRLLTICWKKAALPLSSTTDKTLEIFA